uniref:Gag-pol polyprotein n=1 Tax=Solanum tuberosum TaxID=4113 RepID=M1DAR4_SOLTU
MLHDNMNISRLMVYAQQIEEFKFKRKNKEAKKARTGDGNFSSDKSDGQGRPKSKQRHSDQHHSNTPRFNQEKGSGSPFPKPTCTKYGKKHHRKCLTAKGREAKQASLSGLDPNAPKYGRFYALRSREDKGALPYECNGMLIARLLRVLKSLSLSSIPIQA